MPPMTTAEPGSLPVVNGHGAPRLRLTHPNLYRSLMLIATVNLALGLNFLILQPTFLIYHAPNWIWGAAFILLGTAKIVFIHLIRNLRLVRATMAVCVAYVLFLAAGATEPWFDGQGSLQLPILYLLLAAIHVPLLVEPFINPFTARHDNGR